MPHKSVPRRLGFLVVLVVPSFVVAGDGRTPVTPTSPPSTVVISEPGSYYLTDDFNYPGFGGTVIDITADKVTLDLDGHTIVAGTGPAIHVASADAVAIRDGNVEGGSYGVLVENLTRPRTYFAMTRLFISGAGGSFLAWNGTGAGVLSVQVEGSKIDCVAGGDGVGLQDCDDCAVVSNRIAGCNNGIYTDITTTNLVLEANQVSTCVTGINQNGARDTRVVRNTVTSCSGAGIRINGEANLVEGNLASNNGGDGIRAFASALNTTIRDNVSASNAACGIVVHSAAVGVVVTDNRVPGNAGGCTEPQGCGVGPTSTTGINAPSATLCMNIP